MKFLVRVIVSATLVLGFIGTAQAKSKSTRKSSAKISGKKVPNKKLVAKKTKSKPRRAMASNPDLGPSVGPRGAGQQPLQVRGQARQLSMMLVLKNEKDSINFVKLRTHYRDEINAVEF